MFNVIAERLAFVQSCLFW